ncbi:LAME_0A06304g1_1 [Lachancea meyersii CBS 8951]|uniref:LAME_0A06304g1_1 n=1 Tax=Lachancea meyersii CBS 8951 TaxID=1266667 RepID=A0A1G4IQA0_9SACH|nr:LAME_0A06304g1_1 [Lachancea meyersii CBS 8951]
MSQHQDSSADTSGSSESTGERIWLSGRDAPPKPDSYFKETFEPSSDSGAPSFSVYIDYSKFSELDDISDESEPREPRAPHSLKQSSLENVPQSKVAASASAPTRNIAINRNDHDFPSPNIPARFQNQSSDTVNTDVIVGSRKISDGTNRVLSVDSSNRDSTNEDSWGNNLPLRSSKYKQYDHDRDSRRTISTSMLEYDSLRRSSNMSKPDARSSSHYGDENVANADPSTPLAPIYHESDEVSDEDYDHEKHSNPSIEEAVRLFRQEASFVPVVQLADPRTASAPLRSVSKKPSQGSLQSRVSDQTSRFSQTRKTRRGPVNSSLLSSILVAPHPKMTNPKPVLRNAPPEIPALRKPSGITSNSKQSSQEKNKETTGQEKLQQQIPSDAPPEKTINPYRNIDDDSLQQIYQYRDVMAVKDLEKEVFYEKYIDTPSTSSNKSMEGEFRKLFSVSRVLLLLLICTLIPPLYFIIGIERNCLPDKKLMKMIMNEEHRNGVAAGFLWDVNLRWFRNLCFMLGILEILIILACVGVGFGVGLSRQ